jgi:hypothetical protein
MLSPTAWAEEHCFSPSMEVYMMFSRWANSVNRVLGFSPAHGRARRRTIPKRTQLAIEAREDHCLLSSPGSTFATGPLVEVSNPDLLANGRRPATTSRPSGVCPTARLAPRRVASSAAAALRNSPRRQGPQVRPCPSRRYHGWCRRSPAIDHQSTGFTGCSRIGVQMRRPITSLPILGDDRRVAGGRPPARILANPRLCFAFHPWRA